MIFYPREKSFIDKEIHYCFALFPVKMQDGGILWLESYYYYTDYRIIVRGRKKKYGCKEKFYKDIFC